MNKQKKILGALNYAAMVVCLFFILFLSSIDRSHNLLYFIGALPLFFANVFLINKGHTRVAYLVFSLAANALVLVFDAGYSNPTSSFVFYFPLLFSTYVLTEKKEDRFVVMTFTLVCIFLTNFTNLTPKLSDDLPLTEHVKTISLFNVGVSLMSSMFIFWSYVKAYRQVEEQIVMEKEKLFDSTQMLNAINQNIDVSICRTAKDNDKLLYVNKAYTDLFGYGSPEEVLALHPQNIYVNPLDRSKILNSLEKYGEVKNIQVEYRRKNGTRFWGLLSSVKSVDSSGRVTYDGAIRDITHLKMIEEELIEARNQAENASKEKSKFLSTMSHEIRTPMNAVIALSNLLIKDDPKESQLDSLALLKISAENLMLLLNNILDFSRIEAGAVQLEWIPVDVHSLAEKVMKIQETQTILKDVELVFESNIGRTPMYITDPTKLTQVLNNLVSNAVKFTDVGLIKLSVKAFPAVNNVERVLFTVTDTGVGIDPDRMDKIFDSFMQEDSSVSRKFGGTGLGLAITQKLLNLMDSSLEVKSEKGHGSEFSFELWLNRSDETPAKQDNPARTNEILSVKGVRVLLVEDNISNIAVVKKYLESWEIDFDIVASGAAAIEHIRNHHFDVILMDLHMPGLDGFETTRQIREFNDRVAIIALTADAFEEAKSKAKKTGMNDFITKPFKAEELYEKIASYNLNQVKS